MNEKSSPNLLTLIYGDRVAPEPKKRVIDRDLFSKLIEGKELIEKVKEEAKQYRVDVASECETIKERAYRQGFKEGFEAFLDQAAMLEAEVKRVHGDMEKRIAPVALKAAKKIVGKEIELSPETVCDIISSHLKAVAQHKRVIIWVNPDDLAHVDKKKEGLKQQFEALEAFSLRPREDITKGGCIIETEVGIINATIENQWVLIERAFDKLWHREEE